MSISNDCRRRRSIWLAVLTLLLLAACASSRQGSVSANIGATLREDQSKIDFLWMQPSGNGRYPVLLVLTGSSCVSVTESVGKVAPAVAMGFAVVTPEKRGVRLEDDGRRCSPEYLATNDRGQRVDDALLLLSRLSQIMPRWDGRLVVMGGSEGAAIGPEIAFRFPGTIAVISLAGGGLAQGEELKILTEKWMRAKKASPEKIADALARLDNTFAEIENDPSAQRFWMGEDNTYRRWASYLWYRPLDFLTKLNIPIFLAHGEQDTSAPVESSDAVQAEFSRLGKNNLTYRRYPGLDHHFHDHDGKNHFQEVMQDLSDWVKKVR